MLAKFNLIYYLEYKEGETYQSCQEPWCPSQFLKRRVTGINNLLEEEEKENIVGNVLHSIVMTRETLVTT